MNVTLTNEQVDDLEQYKENFLCATSHELKTPLASQKAYIQILDQITTKNNDQQYKKYIKKIAEQNEKLSKLVNSLLDASKIKGGRLLTNPSKFDISILIQEIIEDLNQSYKHTITFEGNRKTLIYTDKGKVDQVITNLLHNAIKYSPNADTIIVTLKKEKTNIIISIQDFGIGIDESKFEHIFEPFYRIHGHRERTFPGLGMGLFISNEIIKYLGGSMWVESVKGKGSTFYFSLPVT